MESNLTNIGACALERRYIRWYDRKGIDENGILYNKTLGGEGNTAPHPKFCYAAGWNKGISNLKMKGKKFYNNGKKQKMYIPGEQPEDWIKGRLNLPWSTGCTFIWITNGIDNKRHNIELSIPLEFYREFSQLKRKNFVPPLQSS